MIPLEDLGHVDDSGHEKIVENQPQEEPYTACCVGEENIVDILLNLWKGDIPDTEKLKEEKANVDAPELSLLKGANPEKIARAQNEKSTASKKFTQASIGKLRLHWTAEEEEMRKEGVDKFSTKIIKNLSWKKVLEFGCCVFYPTCTPSDLKDKRRNITAKKSSAISRSYAETIASEMVGLSRLIKRNSETLYNLLIEARIPESGAIQGANLYSFIFQIHSLIRQTMTERLIQRSLRPIPIPNRPNSPVPDPGHNEQS
ncbi:hypothetical protein WN943_011343 [Citrus x changshan-huyou]